MIRPMADGPEDEPLHQEGYANCAGKVRLYYRVRFRRNPPSKGDSGHPLPERAADVAPVAPVPSVSPVTPVAPAASAALVDPVARRSAAGDRADVMPNAAH